MADGGAVMEGVIKRLLPERGFGFIASADGRDFFFHRKDLRRGASFPTNTCTCGHDSFEHQGGRCVGGMAPCECQGYQRRQSPGAIYTGQRVRFTAAEDEKGPHASDVVPEA